jgi:hypothetical protein
MKLLNIYKTLITENQVESCVKNFGYELFGHELGGKEMNTGLENNYVRDIHDFTDNKYGEETTPEFMKALKTLKGCMKQYPEVLTPNSTFAYRGVTIPIKYFIDNRQVINFENSNEYIYKANNPIQSWSTAFDATTHFGFDDHINEIADDIDFEDYNSPENRLKLLELLIKHKVRIGFTLQYQPNEDEFIFNSKYFRLLSHNTHEDELIRFSDKPIKVKAWLTNSDDSKLNKNAFILLKTINKIISEI